MAVCHVSWLVARGPCRISPGSGPRDWRLGMKPPAPGFDSPPLRPTVHPPGGQENRSSTSTSITAPPTHSLERRRTLRAHQPPASGTPQLGGEFAPAAGTLKGEHPPLGRMLQGRPLQWHPARRQPIQLSLVQVDPTTGRAALDLLACKKEEGEWLAAGGALAPGGALSRRLGQPPPHGPLHSVPIHPHASALRTEIQLHAPHVEELHGGSATRTGARSRGSCGHGGPCSEFRRLRQLGWDERGLETAPVPYRVNSEPSPRP
jgi:hypothetical protein